MATVKRGMEKFSQWTRPKRTTQQTGDQPHVLNPPMLPKFRSAFDRAINRYLLTRYVTRALASENVPITAITTLPIMADLVGHLPVQRWVYYCVDDFAEWPGLDRITLQRMERELVAKVDVAIAVSETLQDKLAQMGRPSHLLTHGIDLDHWTLSHADVELDPLVGLERPLIVFWGVIDRRMDVAWLQHVGESLSAGTIVLVGPESDPDPLIRRVPRLVRIPPMAYDLLPDLARAAAVLIMPYLDSPVTRAMQPLKLKEYLATGRPPVVRNLPAVRAWHDCLDVADNADCFARLVQSRLQSGLPDEQRQARARLQSESWAEKAHRLEHWAFHPVESTPNQQILHGGNYTGSERCEHQ